MTSKYTFDSYSPEWPLEFEREAQRLRGLLGDAIVAIHHIGSTAVPGLAAKPIVDLLPEVHDLERVGVDDLTGTLQDAGYRSWGAYGLPGHRYFTKDRAGVRTHNVHIFQQGNPEIARHLAFTAYLRAHPAVRDEYERVKRAAYALHPADGGAYNDAKDGWIKRVEREALQWWELREGGPQ